ncbi:hypothetical protein [Actinokineospora iranica]|nr:hypothetical protein [Actinokineospora iranica]
MAYEQHYAMVPSDSPWPHALDAIRGLTNAGEQRDLDAVYSRRQWGFWDQYNGPSVTLGTVSFVDRVLRPGRHRCPAAVVDLFRPVFEIAIEGPVSNIDLDAALAFDSRTAPECARLRDILCATPDLGEWTSDDRTRRATLRVVARAIQLHPSGVHDVVRALTSVVAFGPAASSDPVLAVSEHALDWRGVLLRHYSVGAWRRLWARLVDQVRVQPGTVTRGDLHEWVTSELAGVAPTLRALVDELPDWIDDAGHPRQAEELVRATGASVGADIKLLLLGAIRARTLTGRARATFLGRGGGQFLDPRWVDRRCAEHAVQVPAEFGRALVDDMLAQSRRVMMRKLILGADGRMTVFSKLHERNGRYFAEHAEGTANVGLRVPQLAALAEQVGVFGSTPAAALAVTDSGRRALDLP